MRQVQLQGNIHIYTPIRIFKLTFLYVPNEFQWTILWPYFLTCINQNISKPIYPAVFFFYTCLEETHMWLVPHNSTGQNNEVFLYLYLEWHRKDIDTCQDPGLRISPCHSGWSLPEHHLIWKWQILSKQFTACIYKLESPSSKIISVMLILVW